MLALIGTVAAASRQNPGRSKEEAAGGCRENPESRAAPCRAPKAEKIKPAEKEAVHTCAKNRNRH